MAYIYSILFIFLAFRQVIALEHYECGMDDNEYLQSYPERNIAASPKIGGQLAPAKTPNGSYIKILVIFAQFAEDNKDSNDINWPKDSLPVWANNFLGVDISEAPFPPNTLSNYFYEMSYGQNIVIGEVYPELIIVDAAANQDYGKSNLEVLRQADRTFDFRSCDQWNMNSSYNQNFNEPDGFADAVYIIWRNINYSNWGGIAHLGFSTFISDEGVKISGRVPTISMTVNIGKKGVYTYEDKLILIAHEYGHYLFGADHNFEASACNGTAQRGIGLMCSDYGTLAMNPHEKYLLGYISYTDIFNDQDAQLPDFQSTGKAYRIPIPLTIDGQTNDNPGEFFAVANHQRISPYELTKGTGVFIYHVKNNSYGHNHIDIITADGLWKWGVNNWITQPRGLGGPMDWYCKNSRDKIAPEKLPAPYRVSTDRVNGRDELQEVVIAQYPLQGKYYNQSYWWDAWYNENGVLTNDMMGDSSDAFNMGYNELFSPWSNPSTLSKSRLPSYITVQLTGKDGSTFTLKFYTDSISSLSAPPSTPQNLIINDDTDDSSHPVLSWETNLEPDVISASEGYIIERKFDNGLYSQIAAVSGTITFYKDCGVNIGDAEFSTAYYRIYAKDTQGNISTYSDIQSITTSSGSPSPY